MAMSSCTVATTEIATPHSSPNANVPSASPKITIQHRDDERDDERHAPQQRQHRCGGGHLHAGEVDVLGGHSVVVAADAEHRVAPEQPAHAGDYYTDAAGERNACGGSGR
jgi:hypothetical protein